MLNFQKLAFRRADACLTLLYNTVEKREMSSEISGGTFKWTRPPDWPTQIRQLRQGSFLICVSQSWGLVHSNVPPEISLDISLWEEWKKEREKEWQSLGLFTIRFSFLVPPKFWFLIFRKTQEVSIQYLKSFRNNNQSPKLVVLSAHPQVSYD